MTGERTPMLRWALSSPILVLTLVLAAQTLPSLWAKDVWLPDEVRHAAVFLRMIEDGHWLILHLGDAPYPDKPPLYFWFLAGLWALLGSTDPHLFMIAAALSAWIFLVAHVLGARAMGLSAGTVLVAGLMLLSNWFFVERAHQPRMDLLFASFIFLSHTGFFRAVGAGDRADTRWMLFGFAMAALAVLTKGPLGIAMPLAGLVVFLLRDGRAGVLTGRPMALGLALFAGIMALYVGGIALSQGGMAFLRSLLVDQTLERAINVDFQSKPWFFYLLEAPGAFLPWTLILLVLPWRDMLRARPLAAVRGPDPDHARAVGYLAGAWVSGFVMISLLDYKNAFFLVALQGVLALLAAEAFTRLSARRRRVLMTLIASILALGAAGAVLGQGLGDPGDTLHGLLAMGVAVAVAAALVFVARGWTPTLAAAAVALGMVAVTLPAYQLLVPGLEVRMSPRATAEVLRAEAARGYEPSQFHIFNPGELDYHARIPITHLTTRQAVLDHVAQTPCGAIAIRGGLVGFFWEGRPDSTTLVSELPTDTDVYFVYRWAEGDCPPV